MLLPLVHSQENERIQCLESYQILDSESEAEFDNLTKLAADICETPISLITLVDSERQWFKSKVGLDVDETIRDFSFCAHAINESNEFLIIEDARKDSRFVDNPFVTGEPFVVFYAGVVLKSESGFPLGTICVIDRVPRVLSPKQMNALKSIAKQIMYLLELKKSHRIQDELRAQLEDKNVELGRFATIAAHDLKSPLANISSLTKMFIEIYGNSIDEKGRLLLESIGNSGQRLRGLIDGLLQFSKCDDLSSLTKSSIELTNLKEEIKSLIGQPDELIVTLNSELHSIYSYPSLMDQILVNLFSNSLKYNDKNITEIELSVSENASHYLFVVSDNGPGIIKSKQDSIFNLFQVGAVKDRYGNRGNGIGLASVKKVIERLGGEIHLESEEGDGAHFYFSIAK